MIRPILIHPDPRLRKVCEPVAVVDDDLRTLMDDMLDTMYAAPGIGLAAPQVGVNLRLLVMDVADTEAGDAPEPLCILNPEIVWASEEKRFWNEGCLSVPDVYYDIERPSEVRVRFLDRAGEPQERHFSGLGAICIQHEIDHLNGKLFVDYLGALKRQLVSAKMKKLKRERARTAAP
ncbi:MAG: peptide deformylase [Pseudomonadota bacterium]